MVKLNITYCVSMLPKPSGGIEVEFQTPIKNPESLTSLDGGFVFYDPNLTDCKTLLSDLNPNIKSKTISSDKDFFDKLRNLGEGSNNNLYILCHGSAGKLYFGNDYIDTDKVLENSSLFSSLDFKNIVIYACQVGQDKSFIESLKLVSKSNIFYSEELVGHKDKGGSWSLTSSLFENKKLLNNNPINNILPFSRSALKSWKYVLPILNASLGPGEEGGVDKFITDDVSTSENIIVTGELSVTQANSLSGLTTGSAKVIAQMSSNNPTDLVGLNPNSTPGVDNTLFITVGSAGITTATAANLNTINAATTQNIDIDSNLATVTGDASTLKTTFDANSEFTGLTGAVAVVDSTTESASNIDALIGSNPSKIDISAVTTLTGSITEVNGYKNAINNAKFSGAASNGSSGAQGTNVTTVRLDSITNLDASDLHTAKDCSVE